jgi:5-methylcytosine-specific restriction enzyme B
MSQKEQFTVSGHQFGLDRETVERKLATIKAEKPKSVYVRVAGENYPVKQALAEVTGLIRSQFSTKDATRVFDHLRFPLKQKKKKNEAAE